MSEEKQPRGIRREYLDETGLIGQRSSTADYYRSFDGTASHTSHHENDI